MLREALENGTRAIPARAGRSSRSGHNRVPSFTNFQPVGLVESGTGANAPSPCDGCQFYDLLANSFNVKPDLNPAGPVVNPGVSEAWPPSDPRPTNTAAVTNNFDCSGIDGFFQATNYTGAFDPAAANWLTTPWVNFALN